MTLCVVAISDIFLAGTFRASNSHFIWSSQGVYQPSRSTCYITPCITSYSVDWGTENVWSVVTWQILGCLHGSIHKWTRFSDCYIGKTSCHWSNKKQQLMYIRKINTCHMSIMWGLQETLITWVVSYSYSVIS